VSDTPRTDRWLRNLDGWHYVNIERARELERELNEANQRVKELEAKVNELNDLKKWLEGR
jgi:predicted  nucleic acid-binding Zn-ribbon protein